VWVSAVQPIVWLLGGIDGWFFVIDDILLFLVIVVVKNRRQPLGTNGRKQKARQVFGICIKNSPLRELFRRFAAQ